MSRWKYGRTIRRTYDAFPPDVRYHLAIGHRTLVSFYFSLRWTTFISQRDCDGCVQFSLFFATYLAYSGYSDRLVIAPSAMPVIVNEYQNHALYHFCKTVVTFVPQTILSPEARKTARWRPGVVMFILAITEMGILPAFVFCFLSRTGVSFIGMYVIFVLTLDIFKPSFFISRSHRRTVEGRREKWNSTCSLGQAIGACGRK